MTIYGNGSSKCDIVVGAEISGEGALERSGLRPGALASLSRVQAFDRWVNYREYSVLSDMLVCLYYFVCAQRA